MKVILKADVKSLGKAGELVNTSDGYARNYLFPRGLAVQADAAAMNEFKNKQKAEQFHKQEEIKAANELKTKLDGKTVKLTAKAGANGKLFGSVTTKDVAEKLNKELDAGIDKRKIAMEDIKSFGTFQAEIKIYQGISASVFVNVTEA